MPGAGDALAWAATMLPENSVQRQAGAVYYPGLLLPDRSVGRPRRCAPSHRPGTWPG